jgi:hypothetical protein
MKKPTRLELAAILLLLLVAAFFRLYRLPELPIGLWRDEAANGLEALRVLGGHRGVFYGTREPMFIYLVSLSVGLLGRNPFAVRIVAALAGTITAPLSYLLVKEMFRRTHPRATVVAFLTAFWLATSYWHLNFSRLAFRGVLLPLFASLSFYLIWRGWNRLADAEAKHWTLAWFAAAGASFGLTFYTYTPNRFLPLVLVPFLLQAAWWARARAAKSPQEGPNTTPAVSPVPALAVFALSFLLIFAPLGRHFLEHPGSFFVRSGVSVFSAAADQPLASTLAENVVRQLGMFGFLADPNIRHDPAGRPAFDTLTLAFGVIGIVLALRRWKRLPYLFSLVWFLVMLLPAILTYPELPHYLRAIGALPVAYVFPALGMEATWECLQYRITSFRLRSALPILLGLCLLWTAALTYRDYFYPEVEEIELVKAFDPRFVEIAALMNELDDPDSVWIVPVGPNGEQRMAYYVFDFLHHGEAPHRYVHLGESALAEELTSSCQGEEQALVLYRTTEPLAQPWHELYADSRALIPFLMDKHSHRIETLHFPNVEVLRYQLPKDVLFSFPSDLRPMEADFGPDLTLSGGAYGFGAADPSQAWVALRWLAETTPSPDYGVEITLLDENGEPAVSANRMLLSAEIKPTSEWEPGQQELNYYSFPGLPIPVWGEYSIEVSLYPIDVDSDLDSLTPAAEDRISSVIGSVAPSLDARD